MNWYVEALKNKYATFTGRAHRTEFWMFLLVTVVVTFVVSVVDSIIGKQVLSTLYGLATLVPGLAIGARRLHDTDRSGWWLLIAFIPLIGAIVLIVFYLLDSQPGDNRFGPNPKAAT